MEHRKHRQQPETDTAIERRFAFSGLELRKAEDGGVSTLRGYALRFNSIYDMGWFTEEVSPSALQNANMEDVRVLLNHDPNNILGRTSANTARVGTDNVGLWYEVDLPDSPNGHNARVAIERGDITQSSWGFSLRKDSTGRRTGDRWEMREGKEHRILTDVDIVFDASPVTFPANPDTSVAKRSRDMAILSVAPNVRMEGEDAGEQSDGSEKTSQWDISMMVDVVASYTYWGNRMISDLNASISNYDYYAKESKGESATFSALSAKCNEAKSAIVAMVDAHIDALKVLNASENRSAEDKADGPIESKTNIFNPERLAMELELAGAQSRANKFSYEICN